MSPLGFDAIGRQALGQLPRVNAAVLPATGGSFTFAGSAEPFGISEDGRGRTIMLAGLSASLDISEVARAGKFAFAGVVVAFSVAELESAGGFVLMGVASGNVVNQAVVATGSFLLIGGVAPFVTALNPRGEIYQLIGFSSTFARDFEAWFPRRFGESNWNDAVVQNEAWSAQVVSTDTWMAASASEDAWRAANILPNPWTNE
jgi:hypothetical protein